jgi:hypothetical protein
MKNTITYFLAISFSLLLIVLSASFFTACNSGDTVNDEFYDSSFYEGNEARPDSFREDTLIVPVDTMPYVPTR